MIIVEFFITVLIVMLLFVSIRIGCIVYEEYKFNKKRRW